MFFKNVIYFLKFVTYLLLSRPFGKILFTNIFTTFSSLNQLHIVSCFCKALLSQSYSYLTTDALNSTICEPPSHSCWPASYSGKKLKHFEKNVCTIKQTWMLKREKEHMPISIDLPKSWAVDKRMLETC